MGAGICLLLLLGSFTNSPCPPSQQTRQTVYAALGLSPSGAYSNCSLGGRVRVGSQYAPTTDRTTSLIAFSGNDPYNTPLPDGLFAYNYTE